MSAIWFRSILIGVVLSLSFELMAVIPPQLCYSAFVDVSEHLQAKSELRLEQPYSSPTKLSEQASHHMKTVRSILSQFAVEHNATLIGPNLKSKQSIESKLARKASGSKNSADTIYDYIRGSLVFKDTKNLYQAFFQFYNKYEIINFKNYFINPKAETHYRGLQFSIVLPNHFIVEVQLHVEGVFEAKKQFGDPIYHEVRELKLKIKNVDSVEKRILQGRIKELEDKHIEIMDRAWAPYELEHEAVLRAHPRANLDY